MILIIGLGNPGAEYEGTRHNIGRELVLQFAQKQKIKMEAASKFKSLIAEFTLKKTKLLLACPDTFMNASGTAVKKIKLAYKFKPERCFVAHDDADISLGRTKLSFGRDSAGHKGVESVMRALGTKDFWRFRIGVAAPAKPGRNRRQARVPADKLVLKKFSQDDEVLLKKVRTKTLGALAELAVLPPEKIMNYYNK